MVGSVLVEALLPSQKVAFLPRPFLSRFLQQIRFRCSPSLPQEDERPLGVQQPGCFNSPTEKKVAESQAAPEWSFPAKLLLEAMRFPCF